MASIVVVGTGYAGHTIAKELEKTDFVTAINDKPFLQHNIAALRALVDPTVANKIAVPLNKLFPDGSSSHLVIGNATVARDAVSPSGLRVDVNGRSLRPDYVVLTTGSSYNFPGKVSTHDASEVTHIFNTGREALKKATRVTIVGGGAVGLELAGEIRHYFPEKKVTVVHNADKLVGGSGLSAEFQDAVLEAVKKIGVEVVLGDGLRQEDIATLRAASDRYIEGERVLHTVSGKQIATDLVYLTIGNKINNEAYASSLASSLAPNGRLIVNDFLQVQGFERVFSVGDAANIENMLGYHAGQQATTLIANILHHKKNEPLEAYKKSPPAMAVTLGPVQGLAEFPGAGILGAEAVSGMKGSHMFVARFWEGLNQPVPQ